MWQSFAYHVMQQNFASAAGTQLYKPVAHSCVGDVNKTPGHAPAAQPLPAALLLSHEAHSRKTATHSCCPTPRKPRTAPAHMGSANARAKRGAQRRPVAACAAAAKGACAAALVVWRGLPRLRRAAPRGIGACARALVPAAQGVCLWEVEAGSGASAAPSARRAGGVSLRARRRPRPRAGAARRVEGARGARAPARFLPAASRRGAGAGRALARAAAVEERRRGGAASSARRLTFPHGHDHVMQRAPGVSTSRARVFLLVGVGKAGSFLCKSAMQRGMPLCLPARRRRARLR